MYVCFDELSLPRSSSARSRMRFFMSLSFALSLLWWSLLRSPRISTSCDLLYLTVSSYFMSRSSSNLAIASEEVPEGRKQLMMHIEWSGIVNVVSSIRSFPSSVRSAYGSISGSHSVATPPYPCGMWAFEIWLYSSTLLAWCFRPGSMSSSLCCSNWYSQCS